MRQHSGMKSFSFISLVTLVLAGNASSVGANPSCTGLPSAATPESESPHPESHGGVWMRDLGSGFRRGTREWGVGIGGGFGTRTLGSRHKHDLVIGTVRYGRSLGGNWSVLYELFGGVQVSPSNELLVGVTPFLRYHFPTGGRWLPFASAGVGLTYTTIREPDLGTAFEFNLQGGVGTHYFFQDDAAVTLEYRWLHLSNGGIDSPNRGTNTQMLMAGVSWFF